MLIRFDQFILDTDSGELRNTDGMTRLPPQACAALQLLLENAGEVVSRETLGQGLRPDTPGELDDSLEQTIRQLRVALGDNAKAPRFIETLPSLGYRFIAPVVNDDPAELVEVEEPVAPASSARSRYLMTGLLAALYIGFRIYSKVNAAPDAAALVVAAVPAAVQAITLAILPFDVDSTNVSAVAYRQALSDTLLATLTSHAGTNVRIVGPPATAHFSGAQTPVDSVARALGATHVLSGFVRAESGGVMIVAQLVRVSDKRQLYARRMTDALINGHISSTGDSIRLATLGALISSP
ncbi:MAG: tolB protein [Gemmatimonadetes bacterium]|nr:tolB protein [Gemmatimonadota bacterium]